MQKKHQPPGHSALVLKHFALTTYLKNNSYMGHEHFYENLSSFTDFSETTDIRNYTHIPDDWSVIITDVKGSTKAIETGKYKDVNTIGVAAITTVQNLLSDFEFPYVFGGDGATILLPNELLETVSSALIALTDLSQKNFRLELRVGAVSLKEIYASGALLLVAKYNLVGERSLAAFMGGGLSFAETLIKGNYEKYRITGKSNSQLTLDGLSCRWNPIPSQNGKILTLIVQAQNKEKEQQVYDEVLQFLKHLFEGDFRNANPVNLEQMTYKSFFTHLRDEIRYSLTNLYSKLLERWIDIFKAHLVFKYGVNQKNVAIAKYTEDVATHSDYKKFDELIRMVLDCSQEQINSIRKFLKQKSEAQEIYYGLLESSGSLMTCYVHSINESDHIHFIDGGDGGYALAAKQMKAQMNK